MWGLLAYIPENIDTEKNMFLLRIPRQNNLSLRYFLETKKKIELKWNNY